MVLYNYYIYDFYLISLLYLFVYLFNIVNIYVIIIYQICILWEKIVINRASHYLFYRRDQLSRGVQLISHRGSIKPTEYKIVRAYETNSKSRIYIMNMKLAAIIKLWIVLPFSTLISSFCYSGLVIRYLKYCIMYISSLAYNSIFKSFYLWD